MGFEKDDSFKDQSDKIEHNDANNWSAISGYAIISNPKNEQELDDMWNKFQAMKRYAQRISDMKCMELYDQDNKTRYEDLKKKYLSKDIDNTDPNKVYTPPIVKAEAVSDDAVDFDDIHYPEENISKAEEYYYDSNNVIIRPRTELEDLELDWSRYNDMSLKRRRFSDDKSIELFGIDNQTHYEFLRSKFLKQDIDDDRDSEYAPDNFSSTLIENLCNVIKNSDNKLVVMEAMEKLANISEACFTDDILIQNTINNKIDMFDNDVADVSSLFVRGDLPFYSPTEMEYFGVYSGEGNRYSADSDNDTIDDGIKTSEWFAEYKRLFEGQFSENTNKFTSNWVNKLNQLCLGLERIRESGDVDKINARKQSILELGWNPNVKFSLNNRMKASDRLIEIIKEGSSSTKIIDISDIVQECYDGDVIYENYKAESALKPLFIVFLKSDTIFNKIITKVTKGPYGHVSLGFDPHLKTLYSFNAHNNGFSHESIHTYKDVTNMKVFCVLLNEKTIAKMKRNINTFSHKETGYSLVNLITMPLNVEYKAPNNMVCSQFVDSMLKIANLDLTKKSSSLTTPKDLYSKMYKNKSVYKVFDGAIEKYNPRKVNEFIHKVAIKANRIREFVELNNEKYATTVLKQFIQPYSTIVETKEIPIQFDDEGNLLIQRRNELDFEAEFSKSHKLLVAYEDSDNIEGMKYELCKLWFMNQQIENKVFNKKTPKNEVKELHKARAKILNDFNKYIKLVCAHDKEFNFITYYNQTPFNDSTLKVRSSTLKYTTKYLKSILLPGK